MSDPRVFVSACVFSNPDMKTLVATGVVVHRLGRYRAAGKE